MSNSADPPSSPLGSASPLSQFKWWQEFIAELLLLCMTLATIVNVGRLFSESLWRVHIIAIAVLCHVLWSVTRRLRFPMPVAVILNFAIVAVVFAFLRYAGDSPRVAGEEPLTGNFASDIWADIQAASAVLQEESVPLPLNTGLLLFAVFAIFCLTAVADWSAFRLRSSSADASVSYGAIFIAVMLFGTGEDRAVAAFWFALTALAFVLAHRLFANPRRQKAGLPSLAAVGAVILAVALSAGVAGGLALRAEGEATTIDLSAFQRRNGNGSIRIENPLVSVQSSLRDKTELEVFRVTSETPAYWRTSVLDLFNGTEWWASYDYKRAGSNVEPSVRSGSGRADAAGTLARQDYVLGDVSLDWLPAAFEVSGVSQPENEAYEISFDSNTASLLLKTDEETAAGLAYSVESVIPSYSPELLSQASFDDYESYFSSELLRSHLGLPDDTSEAVLALADAVTQNDLTPFDKARALQDWFRTEFAYDLNVARGHSIERIEDFLAVRRGYCEQFASTFAMMARGLGIPSRVAVGFTPGELQMEDEDAQTYEDAQTNEEAQTYIVRSRNYHSWPEVLIPGAGWVAMEPTPSRGSPTAENYTGVPAQQDEETPVPVNPDIYSSADPGDLPPELQPAPILPETQEGSGFSASILSIALWALAIAAGIALAVFAAGMLWQTHQNRKLAATARGRIALAWRKVQAECASVGIRRSPSTTAHEFAAQVAQSSMTAATVPPDLPRLADIVARASYAPYDPTPAQAAEAEEIERETRWRIRLRKPLWRRWLPTGLFRVWKLKTII